MNTYLNDSMESEIHIYMSNSLTRLRWQSHEHMRQRANNKIKTMNQDHLHIGK